MTAIETFTLKVEIPEFNMAEHLRDLADHHHSIANTFEEMANRQDRIEHDPGFAARIVEAEDQVMGDELLSDMQAPNQPQRSVTHDANPDHDHNAS